jgi:hypothetical protein
MIGSVSNNSVSVLYSSANLEERAPANDDQAGTAKERKNESAAQPGFLPNNAGASVAAAVLSAVIDPEFSGQLVKMINARPFLASDAGEEALDRETPVASEDGEKRERIYKAVSLPDGSKVMQIITIVDGKTSVATQRLPEFSILRSKGDMTMRTIDVSANTGGSKSVPSGNEFIF